MSDYFSSGVGGGVGAGAAPGPGGVVMATSVPSDLKTLIRIVMRTFYGFELFLCMDMLLAYPCIKEEDLADLLRLEAKQVHQNLVNLKKEKFVNERPIMETSGDGKQKSHSYYYINYKMVVNVVKYKLYKMRIQIETEEKQSTKRATYKCSQCHKAFSDLAIKDIFLTMRCDHCEGDVEEDESSLPSRSSGNLLAKLNTQLEVVFLLLQRLEHVRLADDILRPEPMDITPILDKINNTGSQGQAAAAGASAGDKSGNGLGPGGRLSKYDSMNNIKWSDRTSKQDLFSQTRISINFDTDSDAAGKSASARPIKELPSLILANQTTDESINRMDGGHSAPPPPAALNRDSLLLNNIKKAANDTLSNSSNGIYANGGGGNGGAMKPPAPQLNDSSSSVNGVGRPAAAGKAAATPAPTGSNLETIILQKLLIHEKKATNGAGGGGEMSNGSGESLNRANSFITITKKRDFEAMAPNRSESSLLKNGNGVGGGDLSDPLGLKRRRLNNGDIVYEHTTINDSKNHHSNGHNYHHYSNQKSFSDGSDREMDEDLLDRAAAGSTGDYDDEQASSSVASSLASDPAGVSSAPSAGPALDGDLMPFVAVQTKQIRLDRVTPKLISLMTEPEKDYYINVCRQLYTELYEI